MRCLAYSAFSTSGVEQVHCQHDWLWPKRRNPGCDRQNDEIKIIADKNEYDIDFVLEVAQELWRTYYARPRVHRVARSDKAKPRGAKPGKTLAAWMRRHRQAIDQSIKQCRRSAGSDDVQRRAASHVGDTFTEHAAAELEFQSNKRLDKYLESVTHGTLVDVSANAQKLAAARVSHMAKLRRDRKRAAATQGERVRKKTAIEKQLPCRQNVN